MSNLYREILETIPTAAIVVDRDLRVKYCNRAFRAYFDGRERGTLADAISCTEEKRCGAGVKCAYCTFRAFLRDAVAAGRPSFRKLVFRRGSEALTLRIKVTPMGEGLFLGVADNAYETEIAREMSSAQDIQQRLLPAAKSDAPYSFMYIPCREIGGDLPDVYEAGGEVMGVLADVSGKGISAGMLSAFVRAGWDRSERSPAKALYGLNAKFQELNLDERSYVTAVAVRIAKEQKKLIYCAAGHNAPILLKGRDGIDEIMMSGPPVSTWMPGFNYEDGELPFSRGDILVLLTDGVTESRNRRGEQFSLERVEEILRQSGNAQRFIERLKAALKEFCGTFNDDITAIAFDL